MLKSSFGWGAMDVVLIKDKNAIDECTRKNINSLFLRKAYSGHETCTVIAEEMLDFKTYHDLEIVDYKIYCFDGVPKIIRITSKSINSNKIKSSDKNFTHYSLPDFKKIDVKWSCENSGVFLDNPDMPKPKNLKAMCEIAAKLSAGVPCMRVDLYETADDKIYVGELTLVPEATAAVYDPVEYDTEIWADYIHVPNNAQIQEMIDKNNALVCKLAEMHPYLHDYPDVEEIINVAQGKITY